MNMVHYISQSCRNNLSLGESYSSWLTRVTHAVRWKMNAPALPNSQSTALWRGEAEAGSNRYFLDGTFLFTEGLLGTQTSQNCYQCYLRCQHSDTEIMQFTNWHGNSPVKDLSNATGGKWEGKIEGPCFTCPPVKVVLFALRSLTPWQHRGEAAQDLQGVQDLLFSSLLSHRVGGQVSPQYHVPLLLEVLLQWQKAYPVSGRGSKTSTSWLSDGMTVG